MLFFLHNQKKYRKNFGDLKLIMVKEGPYVKLTPDELKKIIEEELRDVLTEKKKKKKKKKKKDACYRKVKRRYKVWPSAYASGALVKCRKVGAKNWGNKSKKNEALDEAELTDEEKEELAIAADQLDAAVIAHGKQAKTIRKSIKKEGKRNCGCGQDPCKTYGIQEKKQASSEKNLGDWFGRKGEKGSKGGWVDCKAPDGDGGYKECAQGNRKKKPYCRPTPSACKTEPQKNESLGKMIEEVLEEMQNEQELAEKKKKKPCKKAKGKKFVKRVNGRCRSYGQAGKAKDGGARIRPGTKKGDAYCARSAKIKKCKKPPCANDLSRKKWKCRGSKSMKEE